MRTFVDNSDEILRRLKRAIVQALHMIGDEAVKRATLPIAQGGNMPVDTGNLMNSIHYESDEDTVIVGTNVEYAIWQEIGTRKIRPKRFLTKALTENTKEYEDIVEYNLEINGVIR